MDRPHPSPLTGRRHGNSSLLLDLLDAAPATDSEGALTASGDAFLDAGQYAKAEASYNEALQLAERDAGLESERVLAPLLGLGNTLAASGRHQQAVPRLQRALGDPRSQYGLFDLRQQATLKSLAASLTSSIA
jgi:tetratricopeptide (TPR) repeat protein